MKKLKKILSVVLIMVLVVTVMPMTANAAVKLNATKKTIQVGKSVTLKVTGTKKKVKWSSSNKKVATVTQKGKVTGKQEGNATITAKIGNKSLKCKVTVQSGFSATEATKNISCTLQDTKDGVVAILKNNNKVTVSVTAKLVYYSNGTMIGTASDNNYAFESGAECALFFHGPYDSNYKDVEYDDYKITMSVEKGSSSLICGAKKFKIDSSFGADNVTAEITNNSGKDLSTIEVACVFYDSSNNAIGYSKHYAECETNGSTDYLSFRFPYDSSYNTVQPSDYKIYVNSAYKYDWEK